MPLFEVAILKRPTKEESERGVSDRLIFGPKSVVAKDEKSAGIVACMGQKIEDDLSLCDVLVRPF